MLPPETVMMKVGDRQPCRHALHNGLGAGPVWRKNLHDMAVVADNLDRVAFAEINLNAFFLVDQTVGSLKDFVQLGNDIYAHAVVVIQKELGGIVSFGSPVPSDHGRAHLKVGLTIGFFTDRDFRHVVDELFEARLHRSGETFTDQDKHLKSSVGLIADAGQADLFEDPEPAP